MFNRDATISKLVQKIKSYSMDDAALELKAHKDKIPRSALRQSTSYRHFIRPIAILKFAYNLKRQTLMEELISGIPVDSQTWGIFVFSITPEEKEFIETLFPTGAIKILEISSSTWILFDSSKFI